MLDYRKTSEYVKLAKLQGKREAAYAKARAITRQSLDMLKESGKFDAERLAELRAERAGHEFDAKQYTEQINELLGRK